MVAQGDRFDERFTCVSAFRQAELASMVVGALFSMARDLGLDAHDPVAED